MANTIINLQIFMRDVTRLWLEKSACVYYETLIVPPVGYPLYWFRHVALSLLCLTMLILCLQIRLVDSIRMVIWGAGSILGMCTVTVVVSIFPNALQSYTAKRMASIHDDDEEMVGFDDQQQHHMADQTEVSPEPEVDHKYVSHNANHQGGNHNANHQGGNRNTNHPGGNHNVNHQEGNHNTNHQEANHQWADVNANREGVHDNKADQTNVKDTGRHVGVSKPIVDHRMSSTVEQKLEYSGDLKTQSKLKGKNVAAKSEKTNSNRIVTVKSREDLLEDLLEEIKTDDARIKSSATTGSDSPNVLSTSETIALRLKQAKQNPLIFMHSSKAPPLVLDGDTTVDTTATSEPTGNNLSLQEEQGATQVSKTNDTATNTSKGPKKQEGNPTQISHERNVMQSSESVSANSAVAQPKQMGKRRRSLTYPPNSPAFIHGSNGASASNQTGCPNECEQMYAAHKVSVRHGDTVSQAAQPAKEVRSTETGWPAEQQHMNNTTSSTEAVFGSNQNVHAEGPYQAMAAYSSTERTNLDGRVLKLPADDAVARRTVRKRDGKHSKRQSQSPRTRRAAGLNPIHKLTMWKVNHPILQVDELLVLQSTICDSKTQLSWTELAVETMTIIASMSNFYAGYFVLHNGIPDTNSAPGVGLSVLSLVLVILISSGAVSRFYENHIANASCSKKRTMIATAAMFAPSLIIMMYLYFESPTVTIRFASNTLALDSLSSKWRAAMFVLVTLVMLSIPLLCVVILFTYQWCKYRRLLGRHSEPLADGEEERVTTNSPTVV